MADNEDTEEIFESELRQLEALRQEGDSFLKRRVTLWGIRWTIGAAMIWGATTYEPAWNWIWLAGAGLAALSLTAIFAGRGLLNRKIGRVRAAAEDARAAAELAESPGEF